MNVAGPRDDGMLCGKRLVTLAALAEQDFELHDDRR